MVLLTKFGDLILGNFHVVNRALDHENVTQATSSAWTAGGGCPTFFKELLGDLLF
jgi:hypothetical protein